MSRFTRIPAPDGNFVLVDITSVTAVCLVGVAGQMYIWTPGAGVQVALSMSEAGALPTHGGTPHLSAAAWEETARQAQRNVDYYRDLLTEVAKHLGPEVYVQDDGGVVDEPLLAKVPELVERLAAGEAKAGAEDRFGMPPYEQVYRWMYAAVVALAKQELDKANSEAEPGAWPCGQDWSSLSGSSKSAFMQKARERLGIDKDAFLQPVRYGGIDVDDLWGDP